MTDISQLARHLFSKTPGLAGILQSLRPHICPFQALLKWVPASGRLLDVGCGSGLLLGLVGSLRPGVKGLGFDSSASAIGVAKNMALHAGLEDRLSFATQAVEAEWPKGPFNVVTMVDVLHHVAPAAQRATIQLACRQVSDDGRFIYKDMASRPLFFAWWNRLHDLLLARQWIHYRSLDEVELWMTAEGARIVERSVHTCWFYRHELLVGEFAR